MTPCQGQRESPSAAGRIARLCLRSSRDTTRLLRSLRTPARAGWKTGTGQAPLGVPASTACFLPAGTPRASGHLRTVTTRTGGSKGRTPRGGGSALATTATSLAGVPQGRPGGVWSGGPADPTDQAEPGCLRTGAGRGLRAGYVARSVWMPTRTRNRITRSESRLGIPGPSKDPPMHTGVGLAPVSPSSGR